MKKWIIIAIIVVIVAVVLGILWSVLSSLIRGVFFVLVLFLIVVGIYALAKFLRSRKR